MAKRKKKKSVTRKSTDRQSAKQSKSMIPEGNSSSASPYNSNCTNGAQRPCKLSRDRLVAILDAGSEDGHSATGADRFLKGEPYFHKGLNHTSEGIVDLEQWQRFILGLIELDRTGDPSSLAAIPFESNNRKWVNPLAGWSVDTELSDTCFHKIPAPPAFDSIEAASEAIELYWMAVLRDLPFARWEWDANVREAVSELKQLNLFINRAGDVNEAPVGKNGFVSDPDLEVSNLFRGGELFINNPHREAVGPYLSQFLLQEIPFGTLEISQRQVFAAPFQDHLISLEDWRSVQNGEPRDPTENISEQRRYISTMRDLATYVHFDQLYEAYFNAALILLQNGYEFGAGNPYGQQCPPHSGIGYWNYQTPKQMLSQNQEGFAVFGGAHLLTLVTEVATRALKAVWRQKWTHLRLRPEAYGGLIEFRRSVLGQAGKLVTDSHAFQCILGSNANGLLPMAYPEGSPMHPAYGAGHATVAGACVTVLKAFFDENQNVRLPVQPSADGLELLTYEGADAGSLTVGVELDKLASNISIGRNMAGVHWRSDYTQSVLLGQRVAVDMLFRQCRDYIEEYCFSFTTFGGGEVHVGNEGVKYREDASNPKKPLKTILSSKNFGFHDRILRKHDREIAEALLNIV